MITGFANLTCPLDGQTLERKDGALRCPDGHSFDVARQGYVNLLPVQHKRSLQPGDSKAMVAARARFLTGGFYRPLADSLAGYVLPCEPRSAPLACLDAGCGEGYYLRELAAAAEQLDPPCDLALLGLDISKWAVTAAAQADHRPTWVVASNARLPFPDLSLDIVICAFGFPVYSEFARVLRPGGHLLMLDPGTDHLRELREILYPSLKSTQAANLIDSDMGGFRRTGGKSIRYLIALGSAELIADLLAMTPHLYRAPADGLARAASLEQLELTVDVNLSVYER